MKNFLEYYFKRKFQTLFDKKSNLIYGNLGVAFSGGLDSSVLFYLVSKFLKIGKRKLYALHINHGISENCDEWEIHCEKFAVNLKKKFVSRRICILNKSKEGIEKTARLLRYELLSDICEELNIKFLFFGHHQKDQVETLLMQLYRGSGLPGLSGMTNCHEEHSLLNKKIILFRPLIDFDRKLLEDFSDEKKIGYVIDETNYNFRLQRNVLRQKVFPLLERWMPGFSKTFVRSSRHIQSAQNLLNDLAQIDFDSCSILDSLLIEKISKLSNNRILNLLRFWLTKEGINLLPSEAQLHQIKNQIIFAKKNSNPVVKINNFWIERRSGRILLCRNKQILNSPKDFFIINWIGESKVFIPEWNGFLYFDKVDNNGIAEEKLMKSQISIRVRSGRERLKIHERRPSKTLKNLFQEFNIDSNIRPLLPLIYLNKELIYVAGVGMDIRVLKPYGNIHLRWKNIFL